MKTGWKMGRTFVAAAALALGVLAVGCGDWGPDVGSSTMGANQNLDINVVLNQAPDATLLGQLGQFGNVKKTLPAINSVTMKIDAADLGAIQALPFVLAANPDREVKGSPVDTVLVDSFANGLSTWDLDAINTTNMIVQCNSSGCYIVGGQRVVPFDGAGVYVAVLDTGLMDTWRQYFPEERIATQHAKSFGGAGGENGNVSEQPNKWEHDVNGHGTHVTSTIIGYSLNGTPINGVAPLATIIPVKVLNQNGFGWSSMVAEGILYVADLKASLGGAPVVINMSLGGPGPDGLLRAAVDYAISKGVILVAAAGNEGNLGMGDPGAYAPVISAAASGWAGEWQPPGNRAWWYNLDVADPTNPAHFYITDFSSRGLAGQDLDVAAPGSWVVGPYQLQQGKTSYYFLGGTSMASPHVAGVVALMAQKNPALTAAQAESILQGSAIPLAPGCRVIRQPTNALAQRCWGANATGAGLMNAAAALSMTP